MFQVERFRELTIANQKIPCDNCKIPDVNRFASKSFAGTNLLLFRLSKVIGK